MKLRTTARLGEIVLYNQKADEPSMAALVTYVGEGTGANLAAFHKDGERRIAVTNVPHQSVVEGNPEAHFWRFQEATD